MSKTWLPIRKHAQPVIRHTHRHPQHSTRKKIHEQDFEASRIGRGHNNLLRIPVLSCPRIGKLSDQGMPQYICKHTHTGASIRTQDSRSKRGDGRFSCSQLLLQGCGLCGSCCLCLCLWAIWAGSAAVTQESTKNVIEHGEAVDIALPAPLPAGNMGEYILYILYKSIS
jgi:hypothetical protein